MAVVTMGSRLTGYLRDKALAWALGAGVLNDAFRTAFRIPNAFRALLAEGALHAAVVPALARLGDDGDAGREARELVRGLTAALLLALAIVVGLGIICSEWLVGLYGQGFADTPGKLEVTVLMNRLMFPYLAAISLAALCQGVLNSRDRFLLSAATPVFFNLVVAATAFAAVRGSGRPELILSLAVLAGGVLQFVVQMPAVRALGFSLRPLWSAMTGPKVRSVLLLMLPGIPVLGINQLNQLVTNRFASYLGEGAVTATYYAYRVTELMFGGLVVQMTTVLLPVLSRQLREEPDEAPATLLETLSLVSFVTLPTATLLLAAAAPVIGVLFGGGAFDVTAVQVTGATLTAYALSLVGTGHAKVMASAFFAQRNTRTPMWGSAFALVVFTVAAWLLVGRLGVPGLGWANTIAMFAYAAVLTVMYRGAYGFGRVSPWPTLRAVARQVVASLAAGWVALAGRGWLRSVDHTGWEAAGRVGSVLLAAGLVYIGVVVLLGGREPAALLSAFRGKKAGT